MLVRPARPLGGAARRPGADPAEQRALTTSAVPTLVVGPRTDVLAWNAAATAVFGHAPAAGPPNVARSLFLGDGARRRFPDRTTSAAAVVARLRRERRERPDDHRLERLVDELRDADVQFARLWAAPSPAPGPSGSLLVRHPVVGVLSFYYEVVESPGPGARATVTVTPLAGTATVARLRELVRTGSPA